MLLFAASCAILSPSMLSILIGTMLSSIDQDQLKCLVSSSASLDVTTDH